MVDAAHNPHAILVTYPLQGHVIPSVHLAIKLASRGFTITFINTKSIHHQITSTAKDSGEDIFAAARKMGLDIRYTTISDGLPLKFNRSLNRDKFNASLLHVFSAHVEEAVEEIVKGAEPAVSCLIADTFFVWPGKMAKKYGLLYISFWAEPALIFTLYYHLHLLRLNGHFGCIDLREDPINYIPGVDSLEPKDLASYLQETNTTTACRRILFGAFDDVREANYVLCNTVQELEPKTISALRERLKFFAVGPIFPPRFTKSIVPTSLWAESDCTSWLDSKPHGSVLFVSFGGHADISNNELKEIAHGLLQSNVNFIWVLRPDSVTSNDEKNPLPDGFQQEETSDRAMIVPWCCQIQVLAHPAIQGFLTHCGWNSILESIWCQVPLLCFPLNTDQFTNRKLVVNDWKIGINLCERKPVTRVEVSKKIKHLMTGKSADELSHAIKEVKKTLEQAVAADGSSEKNMDQFIQELKVQIQNKGRPIVAKH
ncbi:UDP-glycosyltransferase 86A1-like [Olea europaea var. sylvestris]|uniref:UDP-glycosyltransferase 86A1-like n=1 Tax=Olea europaea var. sylvestris TaxID=158386 RepID=UPI000C1D7568|nr:UDP-glycosyltransferase 86A1-like [Olea europaea var. sylvestris]